MLTAAALPLIEQADGFCRRCACGCRRPTPLAKWTSRRWGHIKGQPMRFVHGHNSRLRPIRPSAELFWPKVDRSGGPDACWPWTGSQDSGGYGRIKVNGRMVGAHVVSWELAHPGQPIPPETPWVLHNCPGGDNPACVNPKHLFLGDPKINVRDMVAKGRHRFVAHHGEQHGRHKLTELEVLQIRRGHAAECLGYKRLARRFGVGRSTIQAIVTGRSWAWLKEVA